MTRDLDMIRRGATIFIVGATATALSGLLVQAVVQPATDISDEMWRYPWSNSGAFVAISLLYLVLHLLVVIGLLSFGRSGVGGIKRSARTAVALAVAGTLVLAIGEAASLPIRNAAIDDTSAQI